MSPNVATEVRPAYLDAADDLRANPEQWQAYESKGHCVILAGPGSGKTKVITVKMARMLAEEIAAPRGIACVTFNTECVRELERRLDRLGVRQGPYVSIGTVHSFCLKHVLLPFGHLMSSKLPSPFRVATISEKDRALEVAIAKEISADEPPARWRTRFDAYRRSYLNRTDPEWKRVDEQLANLIERYESILHEKGLIDFDDMILTGLQGVEDHAWVRDSLRSRFPILVVDEYQDLGLPLHRIVLNLCFRAGIRLVAVGDPDQSIYGFTGAKPELLEEISRRDNVEVSRLRFNYRSGKTIIRASQVALGEARDYEAKGNYEGTVDFYKCPNGIEEQAELICSTIIPEALAQREGRSLGDVAVLYLDKNDGDVIATAAQKRGFKFIRIDQGAPYQKTPLIRWLEDCAAWSGGGWKTGSPRHSHLTRVWRSFNRSVQTEDEMRSLSLKLSRFLFGHRDSILRLDTWLKEFYADCLKETFENDPLLRDEKVAFDKLAAACAKDGKLQEFTVAHFGGQGGAPDHLNLITLHSAKGLEFDVVIMMGMEQGRIPSWAATSLQSKREPRRLFYVGLTRARHEVHMTYSGWTVNRYGRRFNNGPSEFLLEVQKMVDAN